MGSNSGSGSSATYTRTRYWNQPSGEEGRKVDSAILEQIINSLRSIEEKLDRLENIINREK